MSACSIEGCGAPVKARGWCPRHLQRWYRHGDPTVVLDGKRPLGGEDDPRHGSASTHTNHACRCERCKAAWADAHREYMHRNPEQAERHRAYQRRYNASRARFDA